jgi:acyl carrier protein
MTSYEQVRAFLHELLNIKLGREGRDQVNDLNDDFDLLTSGLTDSFGLVELIVTTADHFGREIDFDGLDPEKMTLVGPLCAYIASPESALRPEASPQNAVGLPPIALDLAND